MKGIMQFLSTPPNHTFLFKKNLHFFCSPYKKMSSQAKIMSYEINLGPQGNKIIE